MATPMTVPKPRPQFADLDLLLKAICSALQLTTTQYEDAEAKYNAVGTWLQSGETPISQLQPLIYPQGSMALQTTVRPLRQDEFDLDFVLEVARFQDNPMALYRIVQMRLAEHAHYRQILEPKRRCLRLRYAGDFHMDILPARTDIHRGGTCIEVPDRHSPTSWKPSNPKGFRQWFESRASQLTLLEARVQEPLPDNGDAESRPPLKRAVQLLKRHRDVVFDDPHQAPRSIVLTTLAGRYYLGSMSVSQSLLDVLASISAAVDEARPSRIVVPNPTNPEERFCEAWTPSSYESFVDFVRKFHHQLRLLCDARDLEDVAARLAELFGESMSQRAVRDYAQHINTARRQNTLRASVTGLSVSQGPGRLVPKNTFHGD